MKIVTLSRFRSLFSGLAVLCCLAAAFAALPEKLAPVTFDQGRGVIDFNERLRFENRADNFDFDSAAHSPTDDSWFVQRIRLGATWKPDADWTLQLQLQDAREWGSERPNVPFILGAEGNDALDIRLASVTWGDPKNSPVVATLGRQVIMLGDERFVGASEWNNFARTFDAGKVVWSIIPDRTTATLFVSSVVNIEGTTSGQGWKSNHSSGNDLFSGLYLVHKLDRAASLEGYVLWRDKDDNGPVYTAPTAAIPVPARSAAAYDIGQNVTTFGVRYFMPPPKGGGYDSEVELAMQRGNVDRQTTAASGTYAGNQAKLDQDAWALHTLVGYSMPDTAWKMRFSIEYNVASGDTNRSDGENNSFMSLFPSNHKFYGFMDAFAWKNLREAVATVRLVPMPKTTLRIDYHRFSLYTAQDAWYRANGVATVRPLNAAAQTAPRRVGDEVDLSGTWTPRPWAAIDVGYAHFLSGAYVSATGAKSNADFFYMQTTLKL